MHVSYFDSIHGTLLTKIYFIIFRQSAKAFYIYIGYVCKQKKIQLKDISDTNSCFEK